MREGVVNVNMIMMKDLLDEIAMDLMVAFSFPQIMSGLIPLQKVWLLVNENCQLRTQSDVMQQFHLYIQLLFKMTRRTLSRRLLQLLYPLRLRIIALRHIHQSMVRCFTSHQSLLT